jgi:CheY-like chemotaxis protein
VATKTPATQAKRILVVEDELMIRMLLEDMLGELGYTVAAEAARIEEALEATKNASTLRSSTAISTASPSRRLPMPSLPAARRSSLPRAMASCPSPIASGRR